MYKRILIALDLEGVNLVAGKPYEALDKGCEEWEKARHQAALEVNAAADALFKAGVEKVALWDNHGGGGNIIPEEIDGRVEIINRIPGLPRMYFAPDFDAVCYFGYHAMEGTLGGVLAHTMSSKTVQYYKLNGRHVGEIDMDAYIAASHGLPSIFFAGGDIACAQAKRAVPDIVTLQTKKEISRNEAIFRDNGELLAEIRDKIVEAVNKNASYKTLDFPCTVEKSFKRMEDAAAHIIRLEGFGIKGEYLEDEILGYDAHTVVATANNIVDFIWCCV